MTSMPVAVTAEMYCSLISGGCRRTSPPTEIFLRPFFRRMVPKAEAMRRTVSSVNSEGCTPRMSYSLKMERFMWWLLFDHGVLGNDHDAFVGDVEALAVFVQVHAHLKVGRDLDAL